MRHLALLLASIVFSLPLYAQQPRQVVRGVVLDESSNTPIPYANVIIQKTSPLLGATTDSLGVFQLSTVPLGRYDIQVTAIGYKPNTIKEVEVSASKEVVLSFTMKETDTTLKEVTVRYKASKNKPLNNMATLSARMLSVEEAKRYAGGFDDPSRLVSSFAGVASNIGSNGIVVRGNAPQYLQWKMEGIEIPNPNHFADLTVFGGGGLTALSSNLLANSDFFTGAFPGEYGNALSGVFDIFMRNGNNQKNENTFQVGIIGIDAASEGPFKKGGKSSYLFNYRYSSLSLLRPFLPENASGVKYQDLSFKLNFPTKHSGTFALWGIGLIDGSGGKHEDDSTLWKYRFDREDASAKQYMGATGLSHKYFINSSTYIKTIAAATTNGLDFAIDELDNSRKLVPESKIRNSNLDFTLSSFINKKFSSRHTNRTGILVRELGYNLDLQRNFSTGQPLTKIVSANGSSTVLSAYSNSTIDLTGKLRANVGINSQLFTLNNHYTIEPRAGLKWLFNDNQSLAIAYGLHSRLERLNYYFNTSLITGDANVNKNLDFTKAHHFVMGYDWSISDVLHFKAEAYYQHLFNVPVIPDSSFSFINLQSDWFFAEKVENTGLGRNYGLDLTFEKYMSQGYYGLFTTSLFNSEYRAGDLVWRSTRYNRNYLFNLLGGKEWRLGKNRQNAFSMNIRFCYQGGDHFTPVNTAQSLVNKEIVYDEQNAFKSQLPASFTAHFTASYKINRKHVAHEIAFKMLNITAQKEFNSFQYNFQTNGIDKYEELIFVPNLSYRIDF